MDDKERLEALEKEKERMIHQYLSLQDKADDVNEEIYRVCCGIETLNAKIRLTQEQMRKAALKAVAPVNGKTAHPPTNGTPKPPPA